MVGRDQALGVTGRALPAELPIPTVCGEKKKPKADFPLAECLVERRAPAGILELGPGVSRSVAPFFQKQQTRRPSASTASEGLKIMIRIAEKNVYGDDMQANASLVPELLRAGDFVRRTLEKKGMQMRPFSFWGGRKPEAAIFWDCPKIEDRELQYCLREQVPFLLVISENMHLQPNATYKEIKPLAGRVLTYQEDEVDHQHVIWLPYGLDLQAGMRFRNSVSVQGRPFLLGMLNSWKKSEMPGDLYAMRNRLAIEAGKILKEKMFLAGVGWGCPLVYQHKWQRSLAKRFPRFNRVIWGWPNQAYRGALPPGDGKLEALSRCEFALVPENCSSLPGYITEKIFNALFSGCIPIYQGHPKCTRWLPSDIFIPMDCFSCGKKLVHFLQTMTRKKKDSLRDAGKAYLESQSAKPFDQKTYAQTFLNTLEAILPGLGSLKSKARMENHF